MTCNKTESIQNVRFTILFIVCLCVSVVMSCEKEEAFDYTTYLQSQLEILKTDPNNCFSNEQVAASYQALGEFDESIKYYETAIRNCPDDYLAISQLGVTHFLNKNKEDGLKYMEIAIQKAIKADDLKWADASKKGMDIWIKNWNILEKMTLAEIKAEIRRKAEIDRGSH